MNIVYLVFGNNLEHYQQIYFSIFTAMARKKENDRIVVIAEDPSLFNFFEENVEIIINNKNDTLIPRKNVLIITHSFLFSPREKRKEGKHLVCMK